MEIEIEGEKNWASSLKGTSEGWMEDGMEVVTSLNREKLGEIIRSSVRTEELMRGGDGGAKRRGPTFPMQRAFRI